jgi:hypothetical protein
MKGKNKDFNVFSKKAILLLKNSEWFCFYNREPIQAKYSGQVSEYPSPAMPGSSALYVASTKTPGVTSGID